MPDFLDTALWTKENVGKIVVPYLVEIAGEDEKPQLLEMLRQDPLIADVFLKKGWSELAEPILRKHLESGRILTKDSLIYLANLDEEVMALRLENQLLRQDGNIDAVALSVQGHPGVDWDRLRRTAWSRMAVGFGSHHLWAYWGAEMGEKETLRVLLVKANSGNKWERGLLEDWFGRREGLVGELRKRWNGVEFVDGNWQLPSN